MDKYILTFVLQELIQEEAQQEMAVAQEVLNEERDKVCMVFLNVNCKMSMFMWMEQYIVFILLNILFCTKYFLPIPFCQDPATYMWERRTHNR